MTSQGAREIIVAGAGLGGAVAIRAATLSDEISAVMAMSSHTMGTDMVHEISPRPLLLVHGDCDEMLPSSSSADIYRRAREPKKLLCLPQCRYMTETCGDEVETKIGEWLD